MAERQDGHDKSKLILPTVDEGYIRDIRVIEKGKEDQNELATRRHRPLKSSSEIWRLAPATILPDTIYFLGAFCLSGCF